MRNVLVTGGAGFIGSNFVRCLLTAEPGVSIVNLDALTYSANPDNLLGLPDPGRHLFIEGDICDAGLLDRIMNERGIDTIVHFAAESHVDRSIVGPAEFIRTNIVGTFTLLEAARRAWLERKTVLPSGARFHHVSTDEVYGSLGPDQPAFTETTPYDPHSPYAASKASSDHLVRSWSSTYGLPVTITNCSNNYGPRQFPEKLIPLTILNAINGRPIPIYGDGMQIRDWLYVDDHCEAIRRVILGGRAGECYNVGGGNQPTNLRMIEEICSILDEPWAHPAGAPHKRLCSFVADRPGHDRRYALDTGKIRTELGWRPGGDLRSGLRMTVRWYLDNAEWLKSVSARPSYEEWLAGNYDARGTK